MPPLSHIDSIKRTLLDSAENVPDCFSFSTSDYNTVQTSVTPDAATCPECMADTQDPFGKRYRYPLTNCTHCGPRFSIINAIPYDRSNTSMRDFVQCEHCHTEYQSPVDLRFHAQPNACYDCGPRVELCIAFNDLGFGEDSALWGGEFLRADFF